MEDGDDVTDESPDSDLDPRYNFSKDTLDYDTNVTHKNYNTFLHVCFTNSKHKHNKCTVKS